MREDLGHNDCCNDSENVADTETSTENDRGEDFSDQETPLVSTGNSKFTYVHEDQIGFLSALAAVREDAAHQANEADQISPQEYKFLSCQKFPED